MELCLGCLSSPPSLRPFCLCWWLCHSGPLIAPAHSEARRPPRPPCFRHRGHAWCQAVAAWTLRVPFGPVGLCLVYLCSDRRPHQAGHSLDSPGREVTGHISLRGLAFLPGVGVAPGSLSCGPTTTGSAPWPRPAPRLGDPAHQQMEGYHLLIQFPRTSTRGSPPCWPAKPLMSSPTGHARPTLSGLSLLDPSRKKLSGNVTPRRTSGGSYPAPAQSPRQIALPQPSPRQAPGLLQRP